LPGDRPDDPFVGQSNVKGTVAFAFVATFAY
jgi:hypothetical protein